MRPSHRGPAEDEEGHIRRMTSRGTIAVLVSLVVFFYLIRGILLPFVLAGAIAYIATPGIDWLARRVPIPRAVWAIVFFISIVGVGGSIAYLAAPAFGRDAIEVLGELRQTLAHVLTDALGGGTVSLLGQHMSADQISVQIMDAIHNWLRQNGSGMLIVGWGFSALSGGVLTLVILFYFLISGRQLGRGLFALIPPHQRPLIHRVWERTDPVLRRYFIGIALVVVYAMCASYIGLGLVLGLSHAALLAILTGLMEMVPVVGPIGAALLAGLVALHHAQSMWNVIAYVVYATLLRLSIDEFVGPIVLGRAVRIPPVMVIFCFLAGGLILGIAGMIMAIPLALTAKITLATLYDEYGDAAPRPPPLGKA